MSWQKSVRQLFYKNRHISHQFSRVLLIINFAFLLLLFWEFFDPQNQFIRVLEIFFGILFIAEIGMRLAVSTRKFYGILDWLNILDILIILSIFVRFWFEGDIFWLHLMASLRILRSYRAMDEIFRINDAFSQRQDVIRSMMNLLIFIFVMSSVVFAAQVNVNAGITNYVDALYFTIATLTTTGFGDITPVGTAGKLLVILIMIFGVGLFVKLATSLFRPAKVSYKCPHCGLRRHDTDASHCKHCGNLILIETEGE
jgi:voltage-gated potassium channel